MPVKACEACPEKTRARSWPAAPATLRGLSYIAANLRPEDRAEIDCQLDHWSPAVLALKRCRALPMSPSLDGFGAAEQHAGAGSPVTGGIGAGMRG